MFGTGRTMTRALIVAQCINKYLNHNSIFNAHNAMSQAAQPAANAPANTTPKRAAPEAGPSRRVNSPAHAVSPPIPRTSTFLRYV